jgi:hypothetical protein
MKNMYNVLVGKLEGKRPARRPRCRWDGNIKMNLMEIGFVGVNLILLAEDSTGSWFL